jgi:glycosyltransferase involved in cell wall biosynthesis
MRADVDHGRLRVAVISVATQVWGSEISMLQLIPHLADREIDVWISAPAQGSFTAEARRRGIRCVPLRLPEHSGVVADRPSAGSSAVNAVREVPNVLRGMRAVVRATRGAHVIHSNSLLANMDCALAGRATRRPTVIEIHDLVRPGLSRHLLSATVKIADVAVGISTPVCQSVSQWAAGRVRLIPQAVDIDRFRPGRTSPELRGELASRPNEPLIAIVGRVDRVKGVHRVVGAVAALNRSGHPCSLVVVGEPSAGQEPYAAEVRRAAAVLGDRVRFVGMRSDVPAVLRAVDIVVNASDAEPFGLSVLEAQASGVPVVCGDGGGLTDFVADGLTGLLFPVDDAVAFAAALRRLLDSPQLHSTLAGTALSQARRKYSLPARADSIAALYREAAQPGRRS